MERSVSSLVTELDQTKRTFYIYKYSFPSDSLHRLQTQTHSLEAIRSGQFQMLNARHQITQGKTVARFFRECERMNALL